jgi:hypothetical protein
MMKGAGDSVSEGGGDLPVNKKNPRTRFTEKILK